MQLQTACFFFYSHLFSTFVFNKERRGTSQRESKSRADQTRARTACTKRGGSTPSKKEGDKIESVWWTWNTAAMNCLCSTNQQYKIKALPSQGADWLHKAGFFYSGLRRSCGEPERQILQIRWGLLLTFSKVHVPWALMTHIQYPLITNQLSFSEPNSSSLTKLILFIQKSTPAKPQQNEAQPKENTEPVHNGTIDIVKLPVGTKTSQLGLNKEDDMVPVVAFKERRSLRALAGLEEIQTHQRAGEARPSAHMRAPNTTQSVSLCI